MKRFLFAAIAALALTTSCTKEVEVEKIVYKEDTSITNGLRNQIASLQKQINSLNTQNSSLNDQIQNLNDEINSLNDEINDLESSNYLLEDEIATLEAAIATLQEEVNAVEDEVINTESNELGLIYDFTVDVQKTNQYKISNSNVEKVYNVKNKETGEFIKILRDITIYTSEVYHLIEYKDGNFKLEIEAKFDGHTYKKVTSIATTSLECEALIQLFTSDGEAVGSQPYVAHKHDLSEFNLNSEKLWSNDDVEAGSYIRILERNGNSNPKNYFWFVGKVETIYSNGKGLRITRLISFREDDFTLNKTLSSCRKY